MPLLLLPLMLLTSLIAWNQSALAVGEFVLATDDSYDCRTELDYGRPDLAESATFVIRSGYSRGNDDMAEGNYETAVLDFEFVGRKVPSGGTCLFLVATSSLVTEQERANDWAKTFYLRMFEVSALDPGRNRMVVLGGIHERGEPFKVLRHDKAPYFAYSKMPATRQSEAGVSIRSILFLGKFTTEGFYQGKAFMQKYDGGFKNVDDKNYDSVRHVVQWSVSLDKNGDLERKEAMADFYQGKDKKKLVGFRNEVRLLTPSWNGKFVEGENGKPGENKLHRVKLLWRDIVSVKNKAYTRLDLLPAYEKSRIAADLDKFEYEEVGRIEAKP